MDSLPKGRPSKLTPEVQERICQLLKLGNTFRTACEVAGIGASTGLEWRQRGEDRHASREGDAAYAEFAGAVRKAEEEAAARNVGIIQQAAKQSWQAAAWWLERKFPGEWGRVDRHALVRADGDRQQIGSGMSVDQIKRRIVELAVELGYVSLPGIGPGEVIEVEVQDVEPS